MQPEQIPAFRRALLAWYDSSRRDLPWRRTSDPYAIWISEIMLQQTRVAAVIDHYQRFMAKFPTVVALALAPEHEVLSLWSGLGYYRRARLLHRAAQVVVAEHGGTIPHDLATLRRMPGVGVYTSAAVASIAHGVPVAAVDGNVERVLARIEGESEQRGAIKWARLAERVLDPARPGEHNQAMMELGAVICTPRAPRCVICPVYNWCRTRGEHPVAARKKMRSVEIALALVERGSIDRRQVLLIQRGADESIMPGMWELPALDALPEEEPLMIARHSITITNYYVRIYKLSAVKARVTPTAAVGRYFAQSALGATPLTGLARKILRRTGHLKLDTATRPQSRFSDDVLRF